VPVQAREKRLCFTPEEAFDSALWYLASQKYFCRTLSLSAAA
jgi:hypothetical protein